MLLLELKKVWKNRLTWIAFLLCTVIAVFAFFLDSFVLDYNDIGVLPEHMTLLHDSGLGDMLLFLVLPILASFPAACSWYEEQKNNAVSLTLARTGRKQYYGSKALAVVISGFFMGVYPFLLNYAFCLTAQPRQEMLSVSPAMTSSVYGAYFSTDIPFHLSFMLFPGLYMNAPVLNMLLHIVLIGIWCAGLGMLTYAVSFFIHPNAAVVAVLPSLATAVLYILLGAIGKSSWIVVDLLSLKSSVPIQGGAVIVSVTLTLPFLISAVLLHRKIAGEEL